MKKYDIYLFKKLFLAFIGGLFIYTVLFLIQNLFVLSEIIVEKKAPIQLSLLFISTFFPKIIAMTFPFAILFAALFIGTQSASNSELVAVTATGVSPARQLRPYWWFSGIIAVCYVLLLFQIVPVSKTERNAVFNRISRLSVTSTFLPGKFTAIGENTYLMANNKTENGLLKSVVLFKEIGRKEHVLYSIETAEEAFFPKANANEKTLTLVMRKGHAYILGGKKQGTSTLSYEEKTVTINAEGFASAPASDSVQFLNQLPWSQFSRKLFAGSHKAWVLFFKRLLLLLFVLLAPTLAYCMSFDLARGEGKSGAFVASFGIAFVFLIVTKLFEGLSLSHFPTVSVSVPLITFIFLLLVYKYYVKTARLERVGKKRKGTLSKGLIKLAKQLIKKINIISNAVDYSKGETLTGYIRLQFIRIFLSTMIAMEGIYILSIALVNLPKFMNKNANISQIFNFLAFSLPPTLPYVLPFSFVIAAMFHFSWMDSKSELVAIKSLGISVFKVAAPVLRLALILSVLMIFVNTYLSPVFLGKARASRPQAISRENRGKTTASGNLNQLIRSSTDPLLTYYYENYGQTEHFPVELSRLLAFRLAPNSHSVQWAFSAERVDFSKEGIIHAHGIKRFNFSYDERVRTAEPSFFIPDNASFFKLHRPEADEMTSYQLRQYISEQKKIGIHPYRYITSYYNRFASSFSPLILLLVGLPFVFMGKGGRKKNPAAGIAAGIVLVVVYYAFASLFHSFGSAHYLPPFLAAWMINLLFLLGGLFLFTEVQT
ncbi:MAG: YjgP/YjgQ family permease [Acidobacteria bacterium]|nr:YjgP/YjgQ family permease [Acidobacteriota bacterium]